MSTFLNLKPQNGIYPTNEVKAFTHNHLLKVQPQYCYNDN
jgi:hypothetical protein